MDPKSAEKKIERISKKQKQKLVYYMSSNIEFARGQFGKLNANSNFKEQWESLKVSLNSMGGSEKSVAQWKKCWIDLKAGVKKTINTRRKFMNRTSDGSWSDVPRDLNELENQILKIMTIDGDSCTPESGFVLEETEDLKFLKCDELYTPLTKKIKVEKLSPPSTSKRALLNKFSPTSTKNSASKYTDALNEAKSMQNELIQRINKIEEQNFEILKKLDQILAINLRPA